jgi:hypothetical protein
MVKMGKRRGGKDEKEVSIGGRHFLPFAFFWM